MKSFLSRHWLSLILILLIVLMYFQGRSQIQDIDESMKIQIQNKINEMDLKFEIYQDSLERSFDTIQRIKSQVKEFQDEIKIYKWKTRNLEKVLGDIRSINHSREFLDSLATDIQF